MPSTPSVRWIRLSSTVLWSGDGRVARVVNLVDERSVPWLLDTYGGARPGILQAVIAHALSIGARTAVAAAYQRMQLSRASYG